MNDTDFLNESGVPSMEQIIRAFAKYPLDDDFYDNMFPATTSEEDIENFFDNIIDKGLEPYDVKILQGSKWQIIRKAWKSEISNIVRYEVSQLTSDVDVIDIAYEELFDDETYKKILSYSEEELLKYHKDLLDDAIKIEDYDEAASLRDWKTGYDTLKMKVKERISKALEENNYAIIQECLNDIVNYKKTL